MNAEIINPFVVAAFTFLEKDQKLKISKGTLSLVNSPVAGIVNTVIGIKGFVQGQVVYCMSMITALKIASMMLLGMPMDELDELAKSAIGEMGNIITGHASGILTNNGIFCSVTPPSLLIGPGVNISFKGLPTIVIPIHSDLGEITIFVTLEEADPN
jgi:chemotaxis protein CheX